MYQTFYYLIIDFPFLAACFWIIYILKSPYPKDSTRRAVLLAYMINIAILMFASSAFFQANDDLFRIAKVLQIWSIVNAFPLYFVYIKLITCNVKFNFRHLLVLLPGFVLGTLTAVLLYTSDKYALGQIYSTFHHGHNLTFSSIWQVNALFAIDMAATISVLTSTILLLFNIKKSLEQYKTAISQYYTDAQVKVRGLGLEIIVGVVYSIIVVFGSLYSGIEIYQYNIIGLIITVLIAVVPMFLIGFHSQFQTFNIADFQKQIDKDFQQSASSTIGGHCEVDGSQLNDINLNYLAERIVEIVESKKLYLNPELRIMDISGALSTNRTYISQAINHKLGGNFSDFINNYRIEHTKKLLIDPGHQNYTIESIAEDSGYATVASLNRLFKLKTGMTPNQYRQTNLLGRIPRT